MASTFFGQDRANTYDSLLHLDGPITSSFKQVYDGVGNSTPIFLSDNLVKINSITFASGVVTTPLTITPSTPATGYLSFYAKADKNLYVLDETGTESILAGALLNNTFSTIAVSGQSDIVADSTTDTLTVAAGSNIVITTNAGTDTLTIASTAAGLTDGDYGDITVSGGGTIMNVDSGAIAYSELTGTPTLGTMAAETATDYLSKAGNLSGLANTATSRTNLGIGNVENTALSTWGGSANLTTTGTVATGTWSSTITVNDNVLSIRDELDTTKILQFQCSGITTANTRTLTVPDASGTIALTATTQPLDATLTSIAALGTAADKIAYTTGIDTWAETALTAFGRSLIDDANAAAALSTIGAQASDATLTALAAYNTNGVICQTAADTFAGRTITGTANEITLTNGDGVAGNPTVSIPAAVTFTGKTVTGGTFTTPTINVNDDVLSVRDNLDTTKILQFQCSGITTGTTRTLTIPDASGTVALTASTQPLDATLTALAAYNTNGVICQTAADTFAGRTITGTANEITLTNGDGVAGAPTVSIPAAVTFTGKTVTGGTFTTPTINVNDDVLSIRDNLDTSKILQFQCSGITAANTRTLTVPDASGTIALTASTQPLDDTLTALAAYNTNGVVCQTAADTFAGRTITGTANQVTVTNGDGVSGNPTLSLPYNVNLGSSNVGPSSLTFFEDTDAGTNKVTITLPAAGIAADYTLTLPTTDGNASEFLQTDGSGVLTWAAGSGGNTFSTIAVSGQSDVVADTTSDTLTLAAGSNITITTNAGTDTVTIASTGGSGITRGQAYPLMVGMFSN